MIGDTDDPRARRRASRCTTAGACSSSPASSPRTMTGLPAVEAVNLKVHAGEIVGIAGVSGNGQSALVEVLSGQRAADATAASSSTASASSRRAAHMDRFKVFGLPEEPLKNATVPRMSVAENIAFRSFDKPPIASARLVAVARADAREGARADRRATASRRRRPRRADREPLRRQRAARGAGARTLRRCRRADRRQSLLRARLRLGRRNPRADHGAAQPRRGRAAGLARTSTRSSNSPTASR